MPAAIVHPTENDQLRNPTAAHQLSRRGSVGIRIDMRERHGPQRPASRERRHNPLLHRPAPGAPLSPDENQQRLLSGLRILQRRIERRRPRGGQNRQ
jgi:hypothetical protein